MSIVVLETEYGQIKLRLRPDAAPATVSHFTELANAKLLDGVCFYRSDFVVQFGLHGTHRKFKPLPINETKLHLKLSNERGTASFAHWDVPDNGDSEIFINLKNNAHLVC